MSVTGSSGDYVHMSCRDCGVRRGDDGQITDNYGSLGAAATRPRDDLSPHIEARPTLCEIEQAMRSLPAIGVGAVDIEPLGEL